METLIPEEATTNRSASSALCTVALFGLAGLIIVAAYIPLLHLHSGWEDEVYFSSTCLSLLRGRGDAPSVLADYPSPVSPLRFYGPAMFWFGAAVLRIFGFSMRTWRTFSFAGEVALVTASSLLFYRLRHSTVVAGLAALVMSLSLGWSFRLSLPGRMDSWTLALFVLAIGLLAPDLETSRSPALRLLAFGALAGVISVTTARSWPLLFILFLTLVLRLGARRWALILLAVASAFVATSLLLLPLHLSVFGFIAFVRHASEGDSADVSPLLGGQWHLRQASTQAVFYASVVLLMVLATRLRVGALDRFARWLLVVAGLDLVLTLMLSASALNQTAYWGFLFEIAALYVLTEPGARARNPLLIPAGVAVLGFLAVLRFSREFPAFIHWRERDPQLVQNAMSPIIPAGSIVYGPSGLFFYPSLALGADYRYPVDWASVGRASTPGHPNLPSPMKDACSHAAFLLWPSGPGQPPFPPHPYAHIQLVGELRTSPEQRTWLERLVEHWPGGKAARDGTAFRAWRLEVDPQHCAATEFGSE